MGIAASIIRIQLIEDMSISEAGMRCLLENESDFKLLKPVQCEPACRQPCVNPMPDVLLLVMNFGSQCGLECVQLITQRNSDIKILVLCMIEDPHIARRLLELGAKGVICSRTPPNILFRAIREIAAGRTYVDADIARSIAMQASNSATTPFASLTHREFEIARLIVDGVSQQQIGEQLFISAHTVANHHTNILKKLQVSNHIELTKLAIRHGLTTA